MSTFICPEMDVKFTGLTDMLVGCSENRGCGACSDASN